jgi:UDP-glucuronate 4-epimerase
MFKNILVTGASGFIGYHLSLKLLQEGYSVIGLDQMNEYYDVSLKKSRLNILKTYPNFNFIHDSIDNPELLDTLKDLSISHIVHLAAQAGVRYSLEKPMIYGVSNLIGHLNMLEIARHLNVSHFVYASSSSVYGNNKKLPFSVTDPVDHPISLYAATKKADELMSHSYSHLFKIPTTGLRFFTVYGPYGRPDMSAFLFTDAILKGRPIRVFNHGNMRRNFTYIDDIIQGTIGALKKIPHYYKVYNIGNNKSEHLMDFIHTLEDVIGQKAIMQFEDMQPGDVPETIADIDDTMIDLGFKPTTDIGQGLLNFVSWYRNYYHL